MLLNELKCELNRFFKVCVYSEGNSPMFSKYIDEYWHELLKGDIVCNNTRHDSNVKTDTAVNINWISVYESMYGRLSHIWFMDKRGVLDTDKYKRYIETGEVVSAYNCVGRTV